MSTQTAASDAADLRKLILDSATSTAEKDVLLHAVTRLEAAAEGTECPACTTDREAAVTALRLVIRPLLGTGEQLHHEKAGDIARAIVDAGWARS